MRVGAGVGNAVFWVAAAAAIWLGICSSRVCAQSEEDGAIAGRIVTANGSPVLGATIVAREEETGLEETARTGAKGDFMLPRLPVGEYTVAIDGETVAGGVQVTLGEVTEIDPRSAAVSGAADSPANTGQSVSANELDALPIAGGEWRGATLTAANANLAAGADGSSTEMSFRGIDLSQNSTRLDGASADEQFAGERLGASVAENTDTGDDDAYDAAAGVGSGARSVSGDGRRAGSSYAFAGAAVREFRVGGQATAAEYGSALYGHGVGGVVTTVSRSGSSTVHGMGFYTVRDSAWSAMDPFALAQTYENGSITSRLVRPQDMRQQFGGSIGGPLWESGDGNQDDRESALTDADRRRNPVEIPRRRSASLISRIFYFYAFDAERRNFPAISSPGYPGFYSLTATQTALLANRGVSPSQTNTALNYLASLTGTVARHFDQTVNFGRMDWQRNGGGRIAVEYNRVRWSGPGASRSTPVVDRGVASIGSTYGNVDAGVGRWVAFLRPSITNEVRAQLGHELKYETAQAPLSQEPNIGPAGLPPEVSIGPNGFVFGTPSALGQHAYPYERRTEVADVLAWVRGAHLVQMGGDASWIADETDSLTNAEGTFNYDSGATNGKAGGLVDWITDYTYGVNAYPNGACPSIYAAVHDFCFRSYSQSFGEQSVTWKTREWAAFVQDDWRAASRLTLHLGVRYELQQLPPPQHPNPALDAAFGSVARTSAFPEDRNNVGPRIGLDWAPFGAGRGLVRAGFGVYFGKVPGATVRAALIDTALPQSTIRVRITPTTETSCPQMPAVGFGYPCSFLAQPPGVVAATTSAVVFDHRFRLPMVEQGTLELEHTIGGSVLARAAYVMNLDRQLPNSVDINIAPSPTMAEFQLVGGTGGVGVRDGEVFYVPVYSTRVSTNFGPVTDIISNVNATYHGLTLEARRGFGSARSGYEGARGLDFRASWTWSKAIDFGQNGGAAPRQNGQFDPFQVRYDKGLSSLNFPHRASATLVWSPRLTAAAERGGALPAAERTAWRIADGWSLGAIFYESSGRGYSYNIFGGRRLAGGRESINGSGGSTVLPTVGRNTLRLPDRVNLDLRLSRSFRIWRDGVWLKAAAEGFNVLNHLSYSGIEQRAFLVGPPPGTCSVASTAAVTQLVFQDAKAVGCEGINTPPFGSYTSASTGEAQQRQVQLGLRLEF